MSYKLSIITNTCYCCGISITRRYIYTYAATLRVGFNLFDNNLNFLFIMILIFIILIVILYFFQDNALDTGGTCF